MADLSAFPITKRYPPQRYDAIQLYSFPTPNGVKARSPWRRWSSTTSRIW